MRLKVLVVHGDAEVGARRAAELSASGCLALRVSDVDAAAEVLMREAVDSVVCSDELQLEVERAYGALLPVVAMGDTPTAALATMLAPLAKRSISPTMQLSVAARLEEALAKSSLAWEPLVDLRDGALRGRRARMVTPTCSHDEVASMARELGRNRDARRMLRRLVAESLRQSPTSTLVPCTLDDLLDTHLYEDPEWVRHALAILLVVSERDILGLPNHDARERLDMLRALGFSLIVRVGTDIAGLTSVGLALPAYALLDLAELGEAGPIVTRATASIVSACREVNVEVIADVATPEHTELARATGCVFAVGLGATVGPRA